MEWTPMSLAEGARAPLSETAVDLLAAIVESSNDAIVAKSLDGTILSWNRGAEQLYGYSRDEIVGRSIVTIVPPDVVDELRRILARVGAGERIEHYETVRRRKDGSDVDVSITISPILDPHGAVIGASAIARNIGRQKSMERRLAHRALHDALTERPNRVLLRDRIEGALARAHRNGTAVAVLFLDLDRFKPLNDSRGHAVGDQVLQVIAQRLCEAVRPDDTVARFGGDEFVIVCHDVRDDERAVRIARRVAAAVDAPIELDGTIVMVHASIGVVLGRPGAAPEDLVQDADTAMYQMKSSARTPNGNADRPDCAGPQSGTSPL
jgi:diguanylate cyclase (GGDEF)-like protein/PAS domain S-box-containing protein